MVGEAFLGFDKCLLVFMPPDRQTSIDFVNVVYKGCFGGFYFMHDDPHSLLLMEDGASVHKGTSATHWRQTHGKKILKLPTNSCVLNRTVNMWKIVKDHV